MSDVAPITAAHYAEQRTIGYTQCHRLCWQLKNFVGATSPQLLLQQQQTIADLEHMLTLLAQLDGSVESRRAYAEQVKASIEKK